MASMARALAHYGFGQSRIFCPLEAWQEVLGPDDAGGEENEDALAEFLEGADLIVGDPLYRLLVKEGTPFLPLPHTAFSGRCYLNAAPSLTGQGLEEVLAREGLC